MMLSIKVLKITCSVKAYVLRKTRRNWNTGAKRGYAGKILVFTEGARSSGEALRKQELA
jgi:hypothetical protein